MPDREKRENIIRGFERFVQEYSVEYTDYNEEVLQGVLALLKEQEPKVITQEEWDKWRHIPNGKRDPLYVQHSTGGWWILNHSNWMEIAFLTGEIRIWTSRPTKEQMEVIPWN